MTRDQIESYVPSLSDEDKALLMVECSAFLNTRTIVEAFKDNYDSDEFSELAAAFARAGNTP